MFGLDCALVTMLLSSSCVCNEPLNLDRSRIEALDHAPVVGVMLITICRIELFARRATKLAGSERTT